MLIFLILLVPIQIIKELFSYNIKIFPGGAPTEKILTDKEKFRARMNALDMKYPAKKKTSRWEDLTPEEQNLVRINRAATAKAKANWK
ncbi:hypothetical protein C7S20_05670 [Christiangramia fulva]|uniref:Uncharacterized protein n=1 Tax=Christiangramia fulva TaxID=2126553 RepID=A0A2R3Z3F4_9FLAO|nr:hypothetical protein C7S20_05670 [Christiangramia fulva]